LWSLRVFCDVFFLNLKGLHDFERGEGVIGGVGELPWGKGWRGPVAGGGGFGLGETALEDGADGGADADLAFVAHFAESLVEVEDVVEFDAEAALDLAVVVP